MNGKYWKWWIGSTLYNSFDAMISSNYFPRTRYFPRGVSWLFDVQRFIGTRSLGVVVDAGANTGQTVQQILRYAPNTEIYSFEPALETFRILNAKYGDLKNVHCFNLALGARPDKLILQLRENSEHNTLVSGSRTDASPSASQLVDVTTVDSIVASYGLSHLDILKMDVQAWEMEVMRGAANLIANQNVMFVFSEVAFRRDDPNEMQQFDELHSYLEHNGFLLCGFYNPVRYGPRKEFVFFANALYLNPECRLKWTKLEAEWLEWLKNQAAVASSARVK
jgi:FkbM family methyltransferase